MARYIKVLPTAEAKLEVYKGQNKELLAYLIAYTKQHKDADGKVDQSKLILDLNSHQFDTTVLSKQSSSPISRLFEFYRSKHWIKDKIVELTADAAKGAGTSAKAKQKFAKLEGNFMALIKHVEALEDILEKAGIEYPSAPTFEEDDPEDADEEDKNSEAEVATDNAA